MGELRLYQRWCQHNRLPANLSILYTGGPSLAWGAIYKTLYESYLDFVNCLEIVQNIEIKKTYLIFVVFVSVLGVSGGVSSDWWVLTVGSSSYTSNGQNSKTTWNAPETPRTLTDTTKIRCHLYLFILDHFQAIYEIEKTLIQSLINRTPSLGRLCTVLSITALSLKGEDHH